MRDVALGHWHYFTWHLPAAALMLVFIAIAVGMARTLRRNQYGHRERAFRWSVIGWSALAASMASGVVWPYLVAAANLRVDGRGTWHVSNYLGVPLADVPASQVREIRGVDLGGLGVGLGHLEIRLADGSVIRSVRVTRATLDTFRHTLGYPDSMVHDWYGDEVITPNGCPFHGSVR